jgi:hypothetical protein
VLSTIQQTATSSASSTDRAKTHPLGDAASWQGIGDPWGLRDSRAGTNSPAQGLNSADLFRRCDAGRKTNDNEVRGGTRMSRLPFIFMFLSVSLCSASAQGGHLGTPQEQQACSRDASRFCRKQLGDDTSVQQRLQQNRTKLSAACKKVFASHGM